MTPFLTPLTDRIATRRGARIALAGSAGDGRAALFAMQLRGDTYAAGTLDLIPQHDRRSYGLVVVRF